MSVVLGDAHGEHIRLTALSRERAESGDYDDDNWLNSRVGLRCSGFRADYPASLRSDDFDALATVLRAMQRRAAAPATWGPMEPWLELTIDPSGDIATVQGVATERIGYGNSLRFSMPLSAAAMERALDDIALLLTVFPVPPRPATR